MTEDRSRNAQVGMPNSEIYNTGQKAEYRGQKTDGRGQIFKFGSGNAEFGIIKGRAEGSIQKTDIEHLHPRKEKGGSRGYEPPGGERHLDN